MALTTRPTCDKVRQKLTGENIVRIFRTEVEPGNEEQMRGIGGKGILGSGCGGEVRRVEIGTKTLAEAKIIFDDEPTTFVFSFGACNCMVKKFVNTTIISSSSFSLFQPVVGLYGSFSPVVGGSGNNDSITDGPTDKQRAGPTVLPALKGCGLRQ